MQIRQILRVLREETGSILHLRLCLINHFPRILLSGTAGRTRAHVYRGLGITIGEKTLISGPLTLGGQSLPQNLRIGAGSFINSPVYIDAAAPVHLGDRVSIGHHVVIITSDHEIGNEYFRAGKLSPMPVRVGDGCWLAAGAVILPGVTIGAGAVVAAGAVVTKDVAPNTLVGGVPSRFIRQLSTVDE